MGRGRGGGLPAAPVPSSPLCPQELSLLPLTEPTITANFSLFAPFGSSPINGKNQLRGAFGSAVLDSVPDYYSQLLTKVRGGFFLCVVMSLPHSLGLPGHPTVLTPPSSPRTTSATRPRHLPHYPPRRPPPCSRRW